MADSPSPISKFDTLVGSYSDDPNFDPKKHFSEYHHFEEYDKTKEYQRGQFVATYRDNTPRTYKHILYNINFTKDGQKYKKDYVVAEEVLSDDELKKLQKYCRCERCKLPWYSFIRKSFACPCCIGCLKSTRVAQYVINDTRAYMATLVGKA